ncbi:MAG: putative transposase [Bacteroidia bacterium]|jgi:putative transposase
MEKIKQFIRPHNFLLAYCLMPNHFHILIYTRASYKEDKFKNDFRTMLSSYTRAINLDMNRTGSLFQQNTKFKLIDPQDNFDPLICFNYIHLNPKRAFLVEHLKDWPYSSYPLYTQEKESKNVDTNFAKFILDLPEEPSFIETMTEDMA